MTEEKKFAQEARGVVADFGESALNAIWGGALHQATEARNAIASTVQVAASSTLAAADNLEPDSLQQQMLQHVAFRIEDVARSVRETDTDASIRAVANFARANPGLFLAGAAALGFAATRFLKASNPHLPEHGNPYMYRSDSVAADRLRFGRGYSDGA